ncbi:MAG: hypothetical protein IJT66_06345 [Clostridia bacterium]|nr:hypothetical protein [Clostridia bacterium]
MKIWYMNLKDNRGEGIPDASSEKFEYCMLHNIIAIGWANAQKDNEDNYIEENKKRYKTASQPERIKDFLYAFNEFKAIEAGDLVLIRNSDNEKYYLLQIAEKDFHISVKDKLKDIDIGCYKRIEKKVCIETAAEVNQVIDLRKIVPLRTIQQICNPELQVAIRELFKRMVAEGA